MEKEKEIKKITNSGGFGYSGYVRIKLSHGDRKPYKVIEQHNTGTSDFFVFILNCIRGHNSPKDRPFYLQIWDKTFTTKKSNTNFFLECNSSPDVLVETANHEQDKAQVAFTCLMGDSFIAGRSFQGIKIINFDGVEYARIALDDLVEITGSNTNVAVDWVISLGNVSMTAEV